MLARFKWIGLIAVLAVLLLALAGCSDDEEPTIVLIWNASPATVNLAAGSSVIVEFTYPNDGSGWPSLQFVTVTGGTVDAYMCEISDCRPGKEIGGAFTQITGATSGAQVYVSGDPGTVKTYWVWITSGSSVTMQLEAVGT